MHEPRKTFPVVEQAFARASGAPLITGNDVRLLKDAGQNYPAWREARAELNELPLGAEAWRL